MARTKEFDPTEALDLALDVFWRCGYQGHSLRDLLEGMEIARQSVYDTFGDKRSLFLKVLARYEHLALRGMVQHLEAGGTVAAIRGFCEHFMAEVVHNRDRGACLMAKTAIEVGPTDPEIQAVVKAYFGRVEAAFHEVLTRAAKAGEVHPDSDARALARHLVNTLHGLGIMGRSGASRPALRQMLNVALSVLEQRL